jgi:hypothetical protein
MLKKMEEEVIKIRKNLKVAQDRKKSYVDNKQTHKEFKLGDHVYIRFKPKRISLRMETCSKLAPHYYGPFNILERVGPIAYRLALPLTIKAHYVFHISLLKKYVHDANHVIDWNLIQEETSNPSLNTSLTGEINYSKTELSCKSRCNGNILEYMGPHGSWRMP